MANVDGKPVCTVVPSNAEVSMKKLALALCSIAATPRPVVVPDIVTRGYHGIAVERTAEIGALHDVACVNYVVKQGDTMTSIARAVLGSEERVDEIADLNPDVDPRRMKIGSKLWLPPRLQRTRTRRRRERENLLLGMA